MARAILHLRGDLAGVAGYPVIVPSISFRQGGKNGPGVALEGMTAKFTLRDTQGALVVLLTLAAGLQWQPALGRVWGSSEGIAHAPIAAGVYQYVLHIGYPNQPPELELRGDYEFVEAPL